MQESHSVAALVGALTAVLIVCAIMIIPAVFYVLTLQKALNRCSPESRAMNPPMVWLLFVPLFNIIWHFMVVINLAKSLGAEFQKRGIQEDPLPGQKLGMIMCILAVCGIIPILGIPCSLAAFVCWILYWVKIAGYSSKLVSAPGPVVG